MTVTLGPLLRESAHSYRCRAWIDDRAAGELVRTGADNGMQACWHAEGPVREIHPTMGVRGCRKPELLRQLQSRLQMLGPTRRGALAAAVEAYDRGEGR